MRKRTIRIVSSITIASTLMALPYTINPSSLVSKSVSKAEGTVMEDPLHTVSFITSDKASEKVIDNIEQSKEEILAAAKENVEENSLSVNAIEVEKIDKQEDTLDESTAIAASVQEVKKNDDVQKIVEESMEEGKTVYIYGSLTNSEYSDLTGLKEDELSVEVENPDGTVGNMVFTDENIEDEKKNSPTETGNQEEAGSSEIVTTDENSTVDETNQVLKEENSSLELNSINSELLVPEEDISLDDADTKVDEDGNIETGIIGYSLDEEGAVQYTNINVTNYDKEGNSTEVDEFIYVQEILSSESEKVEIEKEEIGIDEEVKTSLIQKSTASAKEGQDRIYTKPDFKGSVYFMKKNIGKIIFDYTLYKMTGDGDKTFDYFTVRPNVQVIPAKNADSQKMWVDVDIPAASDHIHKWKPKGSTSGTGFSIDVGFPWALGVGIEFGDSVSIKDLSNRDKDFARWQVSDIWGVIDRESFDPVAVWISKGTMASAGITARGWIYTSASPQLMAEAKAKIRYDY